MSDKSNDPAMKVPQSGSRRNGAEGAIAEYWKAGRFEICTTLVTILVLLVARNRLNLFPWSDIPELAKFIASTVAGLVAVLVVLVRRVMLERRKWQALERKRVELENEFDELYRCLNGRPNEIASVVKLVCALDESNISVLEVLEPYILTGPALLKSVTALTSAWSDFVSKSTRDEMKSLLMTIFDVHACQAAKAISVSASKPDAGDEYEGRFVNTNFVVYSEYIRALVRQMEKLFSGKRVVCFTTLSMSIQRWLNYRRAQIQSSDKQDYLAVDERWTDYTREIAGLVKSGRIELRRCLLTVADNVPRHLSLRQTRDLSAERELRVLVPTNVAPGWSPESWDPLSHGEIQTWCDSIGTGEPDKVEAAEHIRALYNEAKPAAFIVVPLGDAKRMPPFHGYDWMQLDKAFVHMFHNISAQCVTHELTESNVIDYFDKGRVPEDMFAIGIDGDHDHPTWLLFLAGDVGREMERITLEIVADGVSDQSARFASLSRYTQYLWDHSTEFLP